MDHSSAATPPDGLQHNSNNDEPVKIDNDVTAAQLDEKSHYGDPLSASWRNEPLDPDEAAKVTLILQACKNHDTQELIALAGTPGGFIEDHVRRLVWPILLGGEKEQQPPPNWQSLPPHHDEGQVKLDVHRAFVYYPTGESEKRIEGRKQELSDIITAVLRRHPGLSYFQGYHDIAQVLLLVLGATDATPLLTRLSLLRIRDFMLPTISATNSHLQLLPAILYAADPALCRHLSGLQPFFALAATLTLYAHDIEEYGGIARLFDFLLAREAVMSVYMYATIIMTRKGELFELEEDEPEMLYAILCKLPKPLDLEALISRASLLFQDHPPESLPFRAWRNVSSYSVLKTTRAPTKLEVQTLQQGETYLKRHSDEIERQEARREILARGRSLAHRYRRPVGAVALTVFVGALSIWFGRNGQAAGVQGLFAGARQRCLDLLYTLAIVRR